MTPTASPVLSHRRFRLSVAHFLAAVVLMFAAAPFLEDAGVGDVGESTIATLVLCCAVLTASTPRMFRRALVLMVPAVLFKWLDHAHPHEVLAFLHALSAVTFIGFVVYHLLAFIVRSPRVNAEVMCAGLAGYLMLALLWAMAYAVTDRLAPGSFTIPPEARPLRGFNALYFSTMTLATVGYGDITPVSGPARMLATLQAITGTFYLAIVISRLASMYASERHAGPRPGPG